MKLLNHTSKYLAILLLPLITIWAFVFYYAMMAEIYDSLDDGLENQKILFLQRLESTPDLLEHNDYERWNYDILPISKHKFDNFKERYSDTLMFLVNEKDFEPVRIFESKIAHNDNFYKLRFTASMVEEDDMVEGLITYLIILYVLLMITIVVLNNLMLKKIWQPFHSLIAQLRNFRIEKEQNIQTMDTSIEEFQLLNSSVTALIDQSRARYLEQQHFIENASHELQTPLAISINKFELFLENTTLSEEDIKTMATIMENLGRLTRLNKSLLLLSKIQNRQFADEEMINFNLLIEGIVADFKDFANHKNIQLHLSGTVQLNFQMNKDLAIILLTNLIKNAIIHGHQNQTVTIALKEREIIIQNFGVEEALDYTNLFSRFKKISTDKKSSGLGLAIAKAISEKYDMHLNYSFEEQHTFKLRFPKKSLKIY